MTVGIKSYQVQISTILQRSVTAERAWSQANQGGTTIHQRLRISYMVETHNKIQKERK